jgi:hypothetical protein
LVVSNRVASEVLFDRIGLFTISGKDELRYIRDFSKDGKGREIVLK